MAACFTLAVVLATLSSIAFAEVNAGVELLSRAVRVGDVKAAEDLLDAGVNPDLSDRQGATPLQHAASMNQFDAVKVLLRYHANPNALTSAGRARATPLQYAVELGNVQMASTLIAGGAEVNAKGPRGRTALHFAGSHKLDMLQLLIEKGADVNARDADGDSGLDEAVWIGALDAAAILLAHGAHLNDVQTTSGATPVNEASYRGHAQVVRYLLQFHPELTIPDKRGNGPLANAVRMGRQECAQLLIDAWPKEQLTAAFLGRIIDEAIRRKQTAVVESLLLHGAEVNGILPSGVTPLDGAAATGSAEMVRVLLDRKADPSLSGRNGTSPLEDASLKGFDTVVGMLLDSGASINQVNPGSGTTAIYAAASFGKVSTVELLLKRGADAGLCGRGKTSPYQAAMKNGYNPAAEEIRRSGGEVSCRP